MQLKINWDDPERRFCDVRRIQLHAQNLDPSHLHERLGYWLFREMGVPAPRSTHARVAVNGEYLGLFALTEELDGRFTRANFAAGTGNLYKEVWPFDATGEPRPESDFLDALATNSDEDVDADIITTFAEEFAAAGSDDERLDVLGRFFDVDTLVTTMIVDRAIRHDDGPLHWYCMPVCEPHNFYFYEDPTRERLTLVPWDLDDAFDALVPDSSVGNFIAIADEFGEISNDCRPFPFGAFNLPQRSAACDPLVAAIASLTDDYDRIRADLLAGPFSAERIDEQLTAWTAQIEPAIAEAAELHDDAPTVDEWRAAVDRLLIAAEVLTPAALDFVAGAVGERLELGRLAPSLTTQYRRLTMVDLANGARATIDRDLVCTAPDGREVRLDDVIVETKSAVGSGPVDRWAWQAGVRPVRISKYCTALAVLHGHLPHHPWHRTIARHFS